MQEKAYAKINLNLYIVGIESGYHLLESDVCAIDLADEITFVSFCDGINLEWVAGSVDVGDIPHRSNVRKCCERIINWQNADSKKNISGIHLRIVRNIPDKAGLGGSSAQVAGVLRLLARVLGFDLYCQFIQSLCEQLGSDIKVMLCPGFYHVSGRGELLLRSTYENMLLLRDSYIVLAKIGECSTKDVFTMYDNLCGESTSAMQNEIFACFNGEINTNDLLISATRFNDGIFGILQQFFMAHPKQFGMSGSGSACFAVFDSEQRALQILKTIDAQWKTLTRFAL